MSERRPLPRLAVAGALVAVALLTRMAQFGNPVADMDDQFYWLVGRSWWDGQWPILEIWDRKPVGLFLIYGAIAGVSRSIVAVQIAATLFAAATGWVVFRCARLFVADRPALMAALAYLLMLPLMGGQTGQSPVYYNLFVAGAGFLLLRSATKGAAGFRQALAAMLLCGLALVVKQVSVAEGIFIGLGFLWLMRRAGTGNAVLMGRAAAMVAAALVPTLLGFALFATRGSAAVGDYLQAAYLSIFAKGATAPGAHLGGLAYFAIYGLPFTAMAAAGWIALKRGAAQPVASVLLGGWALAALVGYVMIPNFYPHYALPMLVPLAVMSAGLFARSSGWLYFGALALFALVGGHSLGGSNAGDARALYRQAQGAIETNRGGGCLFVANGPSALYTSAPSCPGTRILFPYHLTLATEAAAVGVDQAEEVARILSQRPGAIVTRTVERKREVKPVRDTIDRALAADYRLVWSAPRTDDLQLRGLQVWARKKNEGVS